MALNSVNTNFGASVALQNLNKTNAQLATTQNRINTGLKVSSAKDNGAIYAIAQSQRADITALNAVSQSLSRGQSVVDVALAAGESISDLLGQLKEITVSLADTGVKDEARTALTEGYASIIKQIDAAAAGATFNGINLIGGESAALVSISGLKDSSITIAAVDLTSSASAMAGIASAPGVSSASAMLSTIDDAINHVSSALSSLGTGSKQLENQASFVAKLQDSMEAGVGNLVDADLAKESSRLQALQTKQQLGIQALSIANQSTSTVLSLFR